MALNRICHSSKIQLWLGLPRYSNWRMKMSCKMSLNILIVNQNWPDDEQFIIIFQKILTFIVADNRRRCCLNKPFMGFRDIFIRFNRLIFIAKSTISTWGSKTNERIIFDFNIKLIGDLVWLLHRTIKHKSHHVIYHTRAGWLIYLKCTFSAFTIHKNIWI